MNQFKPAKVIMLPINSGICSIIKNVNGRGRQLYQATKNYHYTKVYLEVEEFEAYNLYITTDDKIEYRDWCVHLTTKEVIEYPKGGFPKGHVKKILATTDKSLITLGEFSTVAGKIGYPENYLPQPPQQFIEQFIESYNKGEVITEVLVEYDITWVANHNNGYHSQSLKINPKDNTITIKKLKDSWNREEIIYNVIKHRNDFLKFKTSSHYNPNDKEIKEWEDNWIKENL